MGDRLHIVIFGLTVSSSWGNGHATLWRSLIKAMLRRGHTLTFFERDVPYYSGTRDLHELPPGGRLLLYTRLDDVREEARRELDRADLALCTSYCPDGRAAASLLLDSRAAIKAFYDLDTPVTLDALEQGTDLDYLPIGGLADFDLVLSYTGGRALEALQSRLRARSVAPLYGSVDPETHRPVAPVAALRSTLSYLGTYAQDRQASLERLFLEPARQLLHTRFLIGGAQYPEDFPWSPNIFFVQHMPPDMHPAFFSSSRATLNVTRAAMASYGFCPSGRLFEAAACGTPLLSDWWEGLDTFFTPHCEIVPVHSAEEVCEALQLSDAELGKIAEAARERTLQEHTGERRVIELEVLCNAALRSTALAVLA